MDVRQTWWFQYINDTLDKCLKFSTFHRSENLLHSVRYEDVPVKIAWVEIYLSGKSANMIHSRDGLPLRGNDHDLINECNYIHILWNQS
jgi:hypothetical protein